MSAYFDPNVDLSTTKIWGLRGPHIDMEDEIWSYVYSGSVAFLTKKCDRVMVGHCGVRGR